MQLIECVPNISEGRDKAIIDQIAHCVHDTEDVFLLHQDIGYDVNRTVLTFAGSPQSVCEAAFKVIAKASQLIDMSTHKGSHPRIGATDVCPLIPLSNIQMADCVELSKKLGKRVGEELDIPVYLYGESAILPERKSLAYIRAGEYENLFLRIDELLFKPDFGPVICNAKSGATAIGARQVLIAYNINLNTQNINIAKTIAQAIRDHRQNFQQSTSASEQSLWQGVQAIGWYVKEYGCCQVSLNLLDYKKTSLYEAYLGVVQLATAYEVSVTGSEIVGLIPLAAILESAKYILKNQNQSNLNITDETDLVNLVIKFLKLDAVQTFNPNEKVLEYQLKKSGLVKLSR